MIRAFKVFSLHTLGSKRPSLLALDFEKGTIIISKTRSNEDTRKEFPCTSFIDLSRGKKKDEIKLTLATSTPNKPYKKVFQFEPADERDLFYNLANAMFVNNGRAYRAFSEMDKDKSGTLDAKEVQAALNAGGLGGVKNLFADLKDEVKFEQFLLLSVQAEQRQGVVSTALPTKRSSTVAGMGTAASGASAGDGDALDDDEEGGMAGAISELLRGPATRAASATISIMNDISVTLLAGEKVLTNDHKTCSRDFRDRTEGCIEMPLGCLMKVDKQQTTSGDKQLNTITILCKDFRTVKFVFDSHVNQVEALYKQIRKLAFPVDQLKAFAFSHTLEVEKEDNGWNFYDPIKEYKRMGFGADDPTLRLTVANSTFALCPTYPRFFIVPKEIKDEDLVKIASYRSKGRLPAVVYRHPKTSATLSRCAQPLSGVLSGRCTQDEELIKTIRTINQNNQSMLYLMDARPKKAAIGNAVMGKGFESTANYKKTELKFLNIDNIHAIRDAMNKVFDLCATDSKNYDDDTWLVKLNETKWLYYVRLILNACVRMCDILENEGASIVCHCSDGWDRTSQLCSLVKLMLDPAFRTRRGFAILVEQEWLSFGHQFHERYGHMNDEVKNDQRAPIFVQWLDCVYQMIRQFPRSFEFTEEYLLAIADHLYSCRFGTFLYNSENERHEHSVPHKTPSLWTYLCHRETSAVFMNPHYRATGNLLPNTSSKRIVLWENYFLRVDRATTAKETEAIGRTRLWLKYQALKQKLIDARVEFNEDDLLPADLLTQVYHSAYRGQTTFTGKGYFSKQSMAAAAATAAATAASLSATAAAANANAASGSGTGGEGKTKSTPPSGSAAALTAALESNERSVSKDSGERGGVVGGGDSDDDADGGKSTPPLGTTAVAVAGGAAAGTTVRTTRDQLPPPRTRGTATSMAGSNSAGGDACMTIVPRSKINASGELETFSANPLFAAPPPVAEPAVNANGNLVGAGTGSTSGGPRPPPPRAPAVSTAKPTAAAPLAKQHSNSPPSPSVPPPPPPDPNSPYSPPGPPPSDEPESSPPLVKLPTPQLASTPAVVVVAITPSASTAAAAAAATASAAPALPPTPTGNPAARAPAPPLPVVKTGPRPPATPKTPTPATPGSAGGSGSGSGSGANLAHASTSVNLSTLQKQQFDDDPTSTQSLMLPNKPAPPAPRKPAAEALTDIFAQPTPGAATSTDAADSKPQAAAPASTPTPPTTAKPAATPAATTPTAAAAAAAAKKPIAPPPAAPTPPPAATTPKAAVPTRTASGTVAVSSTPNGTPASVTRPAALTVATAVNGTATGTANGSGADSAAKKPAPAIQKAAPSASVAVARPAPSASAAAAPSPKNGAKATANGAGVASTANGTTTAGDGRTPVRSKFAMSDATGSGSGSGSSSNSSANSSGSSSPATPATPTTTTTTLSTPSGLMAPAPAPARKWAPVTPTAGVKK